ncbi:hypothetical protein Q6348_05035 [Isoptericola sp. b441]|uniref:Uncharacterized protein n=1 Tax=Actinotalea lenta TaxID=3064654 RepID=A0ABT9DBH9_9CELL|nr:MULTISPECIES: hypothetical protein [unclassified Isoptericola]MDO8106558.1 hypothetical protein [Isoptericola sp. b441]MDO8121734.1 hypothetical protein [Isoptericola sp. b490]
MTLTPWGPALDAEVAYRHDQVRDAWRRPAPRHRTPRRDAVRHPAPAQPEAGARRSTLRGSEACPTS